MKRQRLPMILFAFAVICLLSAAPVVLAEEPGDRSSPAVCFIRLQPQPGISANPVDGFEASYEQLEPRLLELMADGQIVSFEFLPEIGAVRAIAVVNELQPLAARPEVAGIVPLHPLRAARQADGPPAEPASTDTTAVPTIPPAEPAEPGVTYTVSGVVRDYDGTLVKDARVATAYDDPMYASDWTDASGAYSLALNAGTYHIEAEKSGWPGAPSQTVTVPPAQVVNFALPQRYTISGKVLDWDGTPIAGASISTDYDDPVQAYDSTDATGAYELVVTAGVYHVGIYKSGMPSLPDQTVTVPPNQTVNFTYSQRFIISGKVLDWDGTPIADASISTDYKDPVNAYDTTDATGAYELVVTAGVYHVGIYKSGMPSLSDQTVTVPPNQAVNFTYPRRYAIRGTVRNYDGAPVQGANVSTSWNDPMYASAQTDANGAYVLSVTAGAFTIGASKTGFPDPENRQVTVPPDITGVDFAFPQPYSISGTVRDGAGQPVPGATVWGGVSSVTTAADGTYTTMAGPGDHYVSAQKTGYQSASSVLVPVPPAAMGVDFVLLVRNQTITGRVTDTQGRPLADAYVSASTIDCSRSGIGSAQTAADGTYTLAVPAGTYHVRASKDGFIPAPFVLVKLPTIAAQEMAAQVDFALELLVNTIRGTVRNSQGQSVEDAWIYASACDLSYSAETDATGAYTLTVSANIYSVSAFKSDYPDPAVQTVVAPPDADHVDFILPPVYTISGRVTDPQGRPLVDVSVSTDYSSTDSDTDSTDSDGRYTLYLAAGTYRIGAEEDGYDWPHRTVTVPPNRTDVDFVLTPVPLRIQGFVRDAAGRGVASGWVCPTLSGENTSFYCKTTYYNGAYSKLLPAGTYGVSASASCYTRASTSGVILPPDRTGLDFTIKLRDQFIAGRVTDSDGQPVCGVSLRAKNGESDFDTTERGGRYSMNVPAGTYKVSASKTGYAAPAEQSITVPLSTTAVDFVFQAPGNTIKGVVRDNRGAVMAGVSISASGSGGGVTAVTGADGSYTLKMLNGSWNVVANKPGYLVVPTVRSFTVPPSQTGADFALTARSELRPFYLPVIVRSQ